MRITAGYHPGPSAALRESIWKPHGALLATIMQIAKGIEDKFDYLNEDK